MSEMMRYPFRLLSAFAGLMIMCAATSSCGGAGTKHAEEAADIDTIVFEETHCDSLFVIYGVDMRSKRIAEGDFINLRDLPRSKRPDSSYEGFLLPYSDCVIAFRKDIIMALAPDIKFYVIDGEEAPKDIYDALTPFEIKKVTVDGERMHVETRIPSTHENTVVAEAIDKETQRKKGTKRFL